MIQDTKPVLWTLQKVQSAEAVKAIISGIESRGRDLRDACPRNSEPRSKQVQFPLHGIPEREHVVVANLSGIQAELKNWPFTESFYVATKGLTHWGTAEALGYFTCQRTAERLEVTVQSRHDGNFLQVVFASWNPPIEVCRDTLAALMTAGGLSGNVRAAADGIVLDGTYEEVAVSGRSGERTGTIVRWSFGDDLKSCAKIVERFCHSAELARNSPRWKFSRSRLDDERAPAGTEVVLRHLNKATFLPAKIEADYFWCLDSYSSWSVLQGMAVDEGSEVSQLLLAFELDGGQFELAAVCKGEDDFKLYLSSDTDNDGAKFAKAIGVKLRKDTWRSA